MTKRSEGRLRPLSAMLLLVATAATAAGQATPPTQPTTPAPPPALPPRPAEDRPAIPTPRAIFPTPMTDRGAKPDAPRPPAEAVPRVIPLGPELDAAGPAVEPPRPRIIQFPRDAAGLVPVRPTVASPARDDREIARDVNNLIESVNDPEAEIGLVEGQSRVIQTRRVLSRIVIADPSVADVELLNDQPDSKLWNLRAIRSGSTTMTLWDETDRPVTFRVRVTIDTQDLEARIRQAFPGADVKVRQVGAQIILDGQVPDSKTMSDVLQVVYTTLTMTSPLYRGSSGGGGTGGGGGGGGGMGGGGGGLGGGSISGRAGMVLVNRVTVPGPRQVLLHVKIAEINRSATRQIGVNWLYSRGRSIIGSSIGGAYTGGSVTTAAKTAIRGAADATGTAAPNGNTTLFGVFDSGHFSLFIEALRTNSLAKVLAEPNLMAMDGQPARFLVGGIFPYPVPQSSSIPGGTAVVTVQFQQFGTILTFEPHILANDVIRLDVEPVISELNYGQTTTVNGGIVPSITQRAARTIVELREGQTLAIAGLLQLTTNATTIRIPGLGDLPLVGPWFSGDFHETVETETIILVTPELVSPLEKPEVTEAPGDRVTQPNDPEFFLLGRIEGKLGREFRATMGWQDPLNIMKHFQSEQHWVVGPHGYSD